MHSCPKVHDRGRQRHGQTNRARGCRLLDLADSATATAFVRFGKADIAKMSRIMSCSIPSDTAVALGCRLRPNRKDGAWIVLRLLGFYESRPPIPSSFGGQRSIQLSYGRLFVSIDETPVAGNAPDFARLDVRGSSCGRGRTFESSRARQLLCAEGVAGFNGKLHC